MSNQPKAEQILSMIKRTMDDKLPKTIELVYEASPKAINLHAKNSAFPLSQKGALEQETKTLIYLAVALATGSKSCIEDMMNKAKIQNIKKDKILDVFKISLYAESTRVVANAEIVFEYLNNK